MSGDLVVIRTFPSHAGALVARAVLEAHGIPCVLSGDDAGGMIPALAFLHGVRLAVRADHASDALRVLEGPPASGEPAEPRRAGEEQEWEEWDDGDLEDLDPDDLDPDDDGREPWR